MKSQLTAPLTALALTAAALACPPGAAHAQSAVPDSRVGGRSELFAGGELENYLRYLQTTGVVAPHPWSIRAFSPHELDRMLPDSSAAHPWRARYALQGGAPHGFVADYVRPTVTMHYNSAFPYGSNDGPVWAGRGLTTAAQFGVAARWGVISATIAPVVFWAQNANFALAGNGEPGALQYADLRYPRVVDRPRRFGDAPYAVFDPGQSTVRLDVVRLAVGASTANQTWGVGDRYPTILSNNAAGFPHVFVGTSEPVNLWLFTLHARAEWGRLDQSPYSPVQGSTEFQSVAQPGRRRFASGLVAVIQPRGLPGLEIGGARFFHSPWRSGGPTAAEYRKPFEAFYKEGLRFADNGTGDPLTDYDNQLAAGFGRWVFARSGFELFGEYFREDHSFDLRDLLLEPDHAAGYTLGARKLFRRRDAGLVGVRWELVNLELGPVAQRRPEGLIYLGSYLRQGHTQRGQLLGADVGVGSAAGATLGVDWYTRGGRWSASWTRTLRQDRLGRDIASSAPAALTTIEHAYDVTHALGAEAVLFRGPADITAGLTGVMDFDRDFRGDVFNLNAVLGVRYNLGPSRR